MVFIKKSTAAFNNIMFKTEIIQDMAEIHESVQRLYIAAKELRDVTGQSAVARLIGVVPQVVKNWEKRGISETGALDAQRILGCNANWLLDGIDHMSTQPWVPDQAATAPSNLSTLPDRTWPFRRVNREQFGQLTLDQLDLIESNILMFLSAREQSKQPPAPESYGTTQ